MEHSKKEKKLALYELKRYMSNHLDAEDYMFEYNNAKVTYVENDKGKLVKAKRKSYNALVKELISEVDKHFDIYIQEFDDGNTLTVPLTNIYLKMDKVSVVFNTLIEDSWIVDVTKPKDITTVKTKTSLEKLSQKYSDTLEKLHKLSCKYIIQAVKHLGIKNNKNEYELLIKPFKCLYDKHPDIEYTKIVAYHDVFELKNNEYSNHYLFISMGDLTELIYILEKMKED